MSAFAYARPETVGEAVSLVSADPHASYLAGGTTHLDLILKDAVVESWRLVDITRLPLRHIEHREDRIHVGSLVTMEQLAADPVVAKRAPFLRAALLAGASTQLRNMATIGGNLLQRTRCRYFRDRAVMACNKRAPGTGCAAISGVARMHAILGASEHCIALHASDLCVVLVALEAVVHTTGPRGTRTLPIGDFYVPAGERPDVETVLEHGELITEVDISLLEPATRSTYLKVRDRASYEFALVSAAGAMRLERDTMAKVRVALGGVGTIPWRATAAETVLEGAPPSPEVFRAAAEAAVHGAFTVPGTAFKVELAQRTIVRVLETLSRNAAT
jgi:CO/xanthine dehydrogenase FAD-binding subunit